MSQKQKVSEPKLPDIRTCPRCGEKILIGDVRCPNCNLNVQTSMDQIKDQPAIVMTILLFVLGVMIALAGITIENDLLSLLLLLLGGGLVVSGSLYYAADLFILSGNDRREPLGKRQILGFDIDFLFGNRRKKG